MTPAVRELGQMLAQLRPELRPGGYVFVTVPTTAPEGLSPVMTFTEDEGLTVVTTQAAADRAGLTYDVVLAWLTLRVHSSLEGVGLTAAVSGALAQAGISCNMVAAAYHDHLFVPADRAEEALAVLRQLAARTGPAAGRSAHE